MSDNPSQASQDAKEQIAQLREQVQTLMNERVAPALSQAADTAQQYASQAREIYDDQTEMLSERVREFADHGDPGRGGRGLHHRPNRR